MIGFIVLATWGVQLIRDALDLQIRPDNEQQLHKVIMIGAVAYVGAACRLRSYRGQRLGLPCWRHLARRLQAADLYLQRWPP